MKIGDTVKVFLRGESPYVEVIKIGKYNLFLGEIKNRLVNSEDHGLFQGDYVTFHLVDYGDFKCWEPSPERIISI